MTRTEALALTMAIREHLTVVWELVVEAYQRRAWEALEYSSWDEYSAEQFGTHRLKLPNEERRSVVESLRQAGLSTRAIASATGISKDTVNRTAPVSDETPAAPVTGTDGKVYNITSKGKKDQPATKPPRQDQQLHSFNASTVLALRELDTMLDSKPRRLMRKYPEQIDSWRKAVKNLRGRLDEIAAPLEDTPQRPRVLFIPVSGTSLCVQIESRGHRPLFDVDERNKIKADCLAIIEDIERIEREGA
ncbi:MAG: hypothetical protein GEV09_08655 [Pseudonocardiaceae bacterium]|nr:hypothetical protein [Pseudonocardiaceae bacterium]